MAAGPAYPGTAGRPVGQEQSVGKGVRRGQGEGSGCREQPEEPAKETFVGSHSEMAVPGGVSAEE